jgi:hypothetical protein
MKARWNVYFAAAAALVALGSCVNNEPPPPCPIAQGSALGVGPGGSPLTRLPDFWVSYKLTSANKTDVCAQLVGDEIAFQKFSKPSALTDFTMAVRAYRMGYQQGNTIAFFGSDFADDYIDQNGPEPDIVVRQDPSDPDNKKMSGIGKLDSFPSASNICNATMFSAADESWPEVDIQLVDGGTASVAQSTDVFQGTASIVDDGGVAMAIFPALHMSYQWSDLKFISTTNIPGSVFTGSLTYGENGCSATYSVTGVYPLTPCHSDADCSPVPLPDAGVCHNSCKSDSDCDSLHPSCDTNVGLCKTDASDAGVVCRSTELSIATRNFQGSGLNPTFIGTNGASLLKCDLDPRVGVILGTNLNSNGASIGSDWGACELTVSPDTLSAQN